LYPDPDGLALGGREPNLTDVAVQRLTESLRLAWVADGSGNLTTNVGPEDFFFYIYAMVFSPAYRSRYEDALGTDFPHIPLTTNRDLFRALAELGRTLFAAHSLHRPALGPYTSSFPVAGTNLVEPRHPLHIRSGENDPYTETMATEGRLYINRARARPPSAGQYFKDVSSEVWEFTVGGYQPAADWLASRRGQPLGNADLEHVLWLLRAVEVSLGVSAEIDVAIDAHGGWPLT
jgi:hypothetical protein